MGWFSRRGKDKPGHVAVPLEELSLSLANSMRTVQEACEACERAQDDEFVQAWRELHVTMRTSVGVLDGLLSETSSPRNQGMVELTIAELWKSAERYLVAHVPATAEDMAVLRSAMWERADAARANRAEARRHEVAAARDRLQRLADQVDVLDGGTEADREDSAELRRYLTWALR